MLQEIRERAQGWMAWFIVILISVPFALWGISSYLDGGSAQIAATVNGEKIAEQEFENGFRQFRQRVRDQLGSNYRPELIDDALLREEFLSTMIKERLVLQKSTDMGFNAGDLLVRSYINNISAFSVAGTFNKDVYERILRNQGLTPVGFEAQVRQSLVMEQLSNGIIGTEFSTDAELQDLLRLSMQRRDVDYLIFPAAAYRDSVDISESELVSFYEANQQSFTAPERVKVEYIELDVAQISITLEADEAALLGYYEQHKNEYITADRRRASHILFTVGGDASDVAALKQAKEALQRIRSGADFADLARELSQDSGSASSGGDLNYIDKGVMDQAFEDAVFQLSVGEVSEPVRSSFGYHLIKLTEIQQGSGKSFAEAKDQVKTAYLKNEAEKLFYEYAERLSDLAYEDPNSLQPAADALGIKTKISDWITRDGGSGVFASSKVVGAAFSDDVLLERHNSEAIEAGAEHILVLRVAEHEESSSRPLAEVKPEILEQLKSKVASELAQSKGREMLAALAKGDGLDALADAAGLKKINVKSVDRRSSDVPSAITTTLFRLPRPADGETSFGEALLPNGDFAVLALTKVEDGTSKDAEAIGGIDAIKSALQRSRGQSYYQHMVESLQEKADIVITKRDG